MTRPSAPPIMAWLQDAAARHRSGDLRGAERLYDRVLKANPNNPDALNLKGLVASDSGRHKHAITFFDLAARSLPSFADPYFNKGLALAALGRRAEALTAYAKAIEINPAYADAHLNLGLTFHTMGRASEAIDAFRTMTEKCPMDARGFYNLGACLEKSLPTTSAGNRDAAASASAAAFERALALNPGNPDIHYAYSNLHTFRGAYREAAAHLEIALRLRPHWPDAWNNLANQAEALGDRQGAVSIFDRAIADDPANVGAIVNRGMTYLALGRLSEGWEGYARRFEDPRFPFVPRRWPWPKWQGDDLRGKSILLWGDQGVGDELLYSSMIPEVAARAATCVVECDPRLAPLYRRSFPTLEIVSERGPGGGPSTIGRRNFDYHCSVLDLGAIVRRNFAAFPNTAGVLRADQDHATRLREDYLRGAPGNRVVGVSWRSINPGLTHQKGLKLADLAPVLTLPGVTFVNLQYGEVADEIAAFEDTHRVKIVNDRRIDPLIDLDAFSAQVSACDAIVTISNTTAHFAGALDVPTTLYVPDGRKRHWYWFTEGNYSPWYRAIRLFRMPGDLGTEAIRHAFADVGTS